MGDALMEIVVRATVTYFFLWIVVRGVGKRELSEMSPFDLILLVTIGDLVQQGVTQEDTSLTGAMLAVGTIAFWVVAAAFAQFRSPRTRSVFTGDATVIVRDGVPLERVLRLQRMSLDDLKEAARGQGIADLRDVDLAVLEPEGRISFLQRSGRDPSG
ncbi:MAG TPA: YetF domain-containing protein [Acidimicrobiales bacterium]